MKRKGQGQALRVVVSNESLISSAGGSLLVQTAEVSGLSKALSQQLGKLRQRYPHTPAGV